MKVWFLDTGRLEMDRSQVLWNAPGGKPMEIPTSGVLIEHDDGLILADSGMDIAHATDVLPFMRPQQPPEQTLVAQLELCGFAPADVDVVVNSHLHFDHAGGNRHFPHARVLAHERELAQARAPASFERFAYSDSSWDVAGLSFETFRGDREVAPGVRLVETPGHSAGHCSLLLESGTGSASMLLGFDVAYTQKALEKEIQPTFHVDPVAGQASIARLKRLADEHDADVYLCHDAEAWHGYRRAPDFYEL